MDSFGSGLESTTNTNAPSGSDYFGGRSPLQIRIATCTLPRYPPSFSPVQNEINLPDSAGGLRNSHLLSFPLHPRRLSSQVFDTNRVTTIDFKLSDKDWNELRYQHREAEFFPEEGKNPPEDPYSWFPAQVTINGTHAGRGEIRKKGYIGSNDIRRPALKLRLPVPATNDRFELTLNNNRQDPSLIRQFLAYEVFRRADVPAPRCAFARVTVNGKELGIYTTLEPINAAFLKPHFPSAHGNLYEGGRSDFRSNWVQNFQIKNKQKDKNAAPSPRADLQAATTALEQSSTSILPALNAHFDAEEFFRFWAVECLINETDGYAANMNNFYLYNNPATGKFVFIPWGADSTFASRRPLNSVAGDPMSVIGVGILAHRLYNSEDGAAKYRSTLRSLLQSAWNEKALLAEVDRLEALLTPALPSSAGFKANLQSVRRFIKNRRAELAPELDGPAPVLKSKPLELAKRRIVGRFTGKFSTTGNRQNTAELSGTLWDQPLTIRDVSMDLQIPPRTEPSSDDDARIMMQFALTTDTGSQYYLYLAIDPDSYATGKPIPIDNTRIQGMFASQERHIGMLRGSLTLTEASKTPAGHFTAEVFSKQPKP